MLRGAAWVVSAGSDPECPTLVIIGRRGSPKEIHRTPDGLVIMRAGAESAAGRRTPRVDEVIEVAAAISSSPPRPRPAGTGAEQQPTRRSPRADTRPDDRGDEDRALRAHHHAALAQAGPEERGLFETEFRQALARAGTDSDLSRVSPPVRRRRQARERHS